MIFYKDQTSTKEHAQEFLTFTKSIVFEPNILPGNVTQLYQELGINDHLPTLRRLSPLIEDYGKFFEAPDSSLRCNDIPFSRFYQEMRQRFSGPELISVAFHLGGT